MVLGIWHCPLELDRNLGRSSASGVRGLESVERQDVDSRLYGSVTHGESGERNQAFGDRWNCSLSGRKLVPSRLGQRYKGHKEPCRCHNKKQTGRLHRRRTSMRHVSKEILI